MRTNKYIFYWSILMILGCSNSLESRLIGNWQGIRVVEEVKDLPVEASDIQLSLNEDHSYTFSSTLNYTEKGTFSVKEGHLNLQPTNDMLRKVEVQLISSDTLYVQMIENGKYRTLIMVPK